MLILMSPVNARFHKYLGVLSMFQRLSILQEKQSFHGLLFMDWCSLQEEILILVLA